ncbi:YhdP family protein [Parahaliea mediterranea]|uniref:TIGR02099 family protein n=1 Tax=Parahaliea mediterranea TaxID=651086 RepID=A0A939DBW6_9GAMM|nr:YhdP family protein [Parahaliea mediterranea]MBN7795335.1 TIGR02099 family protein [Parahaliea mediterranea]
MEHAFLHKLARMLWRSLVAVIVLLAVYVSCGRLLMGAVGDYQQAILTELNRRLPFEVSAQRVSGEWRSFSPDLVLSGLRLQLQREPDVSVRLREGRLRLDVLRSLLEASLQVSRVQLAGLELPLELGGDGRLRLPGYDGGGGELGQWVRALVLNMEQLALTDNQLRVSLPGGERRDLALDLRLARDGGRRELVGNLRVHGSDARIDLAAHALGNPFDPESLEGEAYLHASGVDLAKLSDWLPPGDRALAASGEMDLETWLSWREGEPDLETRFSGRRVRVAAADGSWQFPLDRLAFAATLQREDNSWTAFTRDLSLARGDIALEVPRLQLDLWGDSLRLRGEQVPLGPVSALYAAFPATHPKLAEALATLDAGGQLGRLEFNLDDLRAPARGWQLAANFRDFRVNSWRGAPGVRSGEGFVRLVPGSGQVILDSRDFSMAFPTVYDHSLDYDDIHGTVDIAWGTDALTLHSGLITAAAEEGTSRALFGLNVPFERTRAGVEMDLLVGLSESSAEHRHKYLPAMLDKHLLAWLRDSLGEGAVDQGAFLWRGSLRPGEAPLRTVQSFFAVRDTALAFQPDWPPLAGLDGLVLIDDATVSVWADRARLYDSELERLSAEAWMAGDGRMRLAVAGSMTGPAADGARLVRESPLADISGHVFDDWTLEGALRTRLALELELAGDRPRPRVAVSARLRDAQLGVVPLDLSVSGISGEILYDSAVGFDSRELVGTLWGERLRAQLQAVAADGEAGRVDVDALRIDFDGRISAEPLQDWLGLSGRPFASGGAPALAQLRVVPGARPTLSVQSTLEGVALTLPPPIGKAAPEVVPLDLDLQLAGPSRRLDLGLARRLDVSLLLDERGAVTGGEIALQDAAAAPRAGYLNVSGHAPLLDSRQWRSLVQGLGLPSPDSGRTAGRPRLAVDNLQVDTLSLEGVELRDVIVGAREEAAGAWSVEAESDWFQGRLELDPGLDRGTLHVSHLELQGLSGLGGEGGDRREGERRTLPQLSVQVDALFNGGRPLGHLAFDLRSTPWAVRAASITGEVAGLTLAPESPAELLWQYGDSPRTSLAASLAFGDLGEVLEKLDYENILETEEGRFDLALDWPGGPQDFALARAHGRLGIDVGRGRFLDAPASTSGTLRVVSILNLAEIVRRLSLSHMFESGIPFNDVDGEMLFNAGTIEVPSVRIEGASSSFTLSAVSSVEQRTLNGELVATLPVANNLPWVAALTAGLPVAAGVFVVSKVFEQQVNRMTSAVYSVQGGWDDPEVKFDRIFDTGGGRQRAPAATVENETTPPVGSNSFDQIPPPTD